MELKPNLGVALDFAKLRLGQSPKACLFSELQSAWSADTLRFGYGTSCLQQLQELPQTYFGAMRHCLVCSSTVGAQFRHQQCFCVSE
jgi:hypothetical protein